MKKDEMKNQPFHKRMGYAFHGLYAALFNERSFRKQVILGVLAISYFAWLNIPLIWWAIMILYISAILAAELMNSAVEKLIDHIHPEIHPVIKTVKDTLAASVLVVSFSSIFFFAFVTWEFWPRS